MDWLPNEGAIRWLIGEILPLIRESIPPVTLTVVGRTPSASLVEMNKLYASIVGTGGVADVRQFMDSECIHRADTNRWTSKPAKKLFFVMTRGSLRTML